MKPVEPFIPAPAEHPGHTITREQFFNLFAAVFLPMFMAAVDQTLLATATPVIAESLGGLRDTSWIAVAYLLASAVIVPAYGRYGDMKGRRNMLVVALVIFALGSVACAAAQSLPQLVAGRILQGLGGGGLMTLSQALIGELVPPRERVRFQGYFAIIFTSASVGGPVIGGLVVSHFSWRWLFLANLPFTAFALWRLSKLPPGERHAQPPGNGDIAGIALFFVGALSALFWLTSVGHRFSWSSTASIVLLLLACIALGGLFWHESRHGAPFLPIDLLRQPTIKYSAMTIALFAACMFAMVFFLPIYLQIGHHFSPAASGLLLLPLTGGMVIAALSSGRILSRTGEPRRIPMIGMAISSVALCLLGVLPGYTAVVAILGFIAGAGFGTVMPIMQVVIQTVAGRPRLGAVTAVASLARSIGAALGAAVFGALAFALMPEAGMRALTLPGASDLNDSVLRAFHHAFLFAAAAAALAAFTASRVPHMTLWSRRNPRAKDPPPS